MDMACMASMPDCRSHLAVAAEEEAGALKEWAVRGALGSPAWAPQTWGPQSLAALGLLSWGPLPWAVLEWTLRELHSGLILGRTLKGCVAAQAICHNLQLAS